MADPRLLIQRVARGLGQLLTIDGGQLPRTLLPDTRATIDTMQFYGLTQFQRLSNSNAAATEGSIFSFTVPDNVTWVLFDFGLTIVKTATMTAAWMTFQINSTPIFGQSMGPFGATESGTIGAGASMPYPRILLPGTQVFGALNILGTDANANAGASINIGVLG